jgi:cereblon
MFANPAGRVFELLTVRAATSVEAWGTPTTEHTWFVGYAWRVLLCANCVNHLGWRFDAVSGGEPPAFFGFVTSEIVQDGD